jgi:hypothetical protein
MILIRFLFIAIAILYIIRSIARVVLPMLFQSVVNKAQQHSQQQYRQPDRADERVKVDFIPQGKKGTIPDSEGDFIDYEEVK